MARTQRGGPVPAGRIGWVALDTNVFGKGQVQLERLARFAADLEKVSVRVLVHELVVWEWGEHAANAYNKLRGDVRTAVATIRAAGLDRHVALNMPELDTRVIVQDLQKDVEKTPNVTVVDATPEGMRAGMEAQVLLLGPGKRKGRTEKYAGTKTGAADHAAVHDIVVHVQREGGGRLAIVSADGDIDHSLKELGATWVARYTNTSQALERLGALHFVEAQGSVTDSIAAAFVGYILERVATNSGQEELISLVTPVDTRSPNLFARIVENYAVGRVRGVAWVERMRTTADGTDDGRAVAARVGLLVDGKVTTTEPPVGLEDLWTWTSRDNVLAVDLTAALSNSMVTDVRPISTAQFAHSARDLASVEEAKEELARALGEAPIIGDVDWWATILDDGVPDDVPQWLDWERNDFLDSDEYYAITFIVDGEQMIVEIENLWFDHHEDGEVTVKAEPGGAGQAEHVEGPQGVAAELVRMAHRHGHEAVAGDAAAR